MDRTLIARGPCVIETGGARFWTKGDVMINVDFETFNIVTSGKGKVDERPKNRMATIDYTPAGMLTSLILAALYPYMGTTFSQGKSIITGATRVISIVDNATYDFPATGISKLCDLDFSAERELYGPGQIIALTENTKSWTDADGLIKYTAGSGNFTDSVYDISKIYTLSPIVNYGGLLSNVETTDGVKVKFNLQLGDIPSDNDGIVDKTFKQLDVSAAFKPLYISAAAQQAAAKIYTQTKGKSFNTGSNLIISPKDGSPSPTVTLYKAGAKGSKLAFSPEKSRYDEMNYIATLDTTNGLFSIA